MLCLPQRGRKAVSRRTFLRRIALAFSAGVLPGTGGVFSALGADDGGGEPAPTAREAAAMARVVTETMERHGAPALSVAVARHGRMVYQQGFGYADKRAGAPATAGSLFRIASVSKPITAVAIFSLIEQGRLGLGDRVFGERGRLGFEYGKDYPAGVGEITLHHLLTHTGGGWENDGDDPMFRERTMNHRELITWTLRHQPLKHEPGTHYGYSNFGYCILGRVIEKVTGQSYADYVQQAVLAKCGIKDMRLAGNTLAQRAPGEVIYYGRSDADTEPYEMNVTRMDSHGGWLATPGDMVRFAEHVDGFQTTPNILRAETVKTMTTGTQANPHYACGWCVNQIPNWWHTGSLPGTLTVMVRTGSGLCWAAFTNTRVEGIDLDAMMWRVVQCVPAWHA
jgi:CubicO group peptidase (beta-lactamase class C family)